MAESLGLTKGSIIQQIQNKDIKTTTELNGNLTANLGNTISLTWLNEKGEKITKQASVTKRENSRQGNLGCNYHRIY